MATDIDGDILGYTFYFGDGSYAYANETESVTVNATHAYSAQGSYQAFPVFSGPLVMTVYSAFALTLVHGWNLVDVPLVDYGYKASTLGLQYSDAVVVWNSSTQSYAQSYIVGVSPPFTDFNITPGIGYWIYAQNPETLQIIGNIPNDTQIVYLPLTGAGGWHVMGFLGLKIYHASQIPGMFTRSLTAIATYDEIAHVYETYIVGVPMTDFPIPPGQAFWLCSTTGGTFTYEP